MSVHNSNSRGWGGGGGVGLGDSGFRETWGSKFGNNTYHYGLLDL